MRTAYRYFFTMSFMWAFICSLHVSFFPAQADAAVQLEGVALESGFRSSYNYVAYSGYWLEPLYYYVFCGEGDIGVWLAEIDAVIESRYTSTISRSGLYEDCERHTAMYNSRFWEGPGPICKQCTDSSTEDSGLQCYQGQTDRITLIAGAITTNEQWGCSELPYCEEAYANCGEKSVPAASSHTFSRSESSYTFKLECPGQKVVSFIEIVAYVRINRDGQRPPGIFLINTPLQVIRMIITRGTSRLTNNVEIL